MNTPTAAKSSTENATPASPPINQFPAARFCKALRMPPMAMLIGFLWLGEIPTVFGLIGGVKTMGFLGLFIGPVLMALLVAIWREWIREIELSDEATLIAANAPLEGEAPRALEPPRDETQQKRTQAG